MTDITLNNLTEILTDFEHKVPGGGHGLQVSRAISNTGGFYLSYRYYPIGTSEIQTRRVLISAEVSENLEVLLSKHQRVLEYFNEVV